MGMYVGGFVEGISNQSIVATNNDSLALKIGLDYEGRRPVYFIVGSTPLLVCSLLTISVSLFGATLNGCILSAFRLNRSLITPFTAHVLVLTIINLTAALAVAAFFIPVHNFHAGCLRVRAVCGLYRFVTFLMRYLIVHQHLLICGDRWLALLVPIWYSNHKRVRYSGMAALLCLALGTVWTVIVVGYEFSFALPPGAYCGEPARSSLLRLVVAVTILFPQGLIYLSNPFLLYFVWKRRKCNDVQRRSTIMSEQVSLDLIPRNASEPKLTHLDKPDGCLRMPLERKRSNSSGRNTAMVAWLTVAQIFLWLPNTVIAMARLEYSPLHTEDVVTILSLLGTWLLVADPLIHLAFLPDLRRETAKVLRSRCSSRGV